MHMPVFKFCAIATICHHLEVKLVYHWACRKLITPTYSFRGYGITAPVVARLCMKASTGNVNLS